MKKIILSILIMFVSVTSSLTMMSADLNNNNNNDNEKREALKKAWIGIALNLINVRDIKEAKTLDQLKTAYKVILKFSLTSKMHAEIIRDLLNNFKLKINEKEISLKDYYLERKSKFIPQYVKTKLEENIRTMSADWLNDINSQDHQGKTALIYSIEYAYANENLIKLAKFLVENGADINIKDNQNKTALIYSLQYAYTLNSDELIKFAKFLIKKGADVNAQDNERKTALFYACSQELYEIIELLIKNGANINEKDKYGMTVLGYASDKNNSYLIEFLCKNKPDLNVKDKHGISPLMHAVEERNNDLVNFWLNQEDIIVDQTDDNGTTELMYAAGDDRRLTIAQLLIHKGANVNLQNAEGKTALIIAADCRSYEVAKLLIYHGADASITTVKGETALDIARKNKFSKIVKLLEEKSKKKDECIVQ